MSRRSLIMAIVIGVSFLAVTANAAVPSSINVQGRLTDSTGSPLPTGPKTFSFSIWNAEVGGAKIWPAGVEVQIRSTDAQGLWSAEVGVIANLTEDVFADTVCWLEITVNDDDNPITTLPRTRLVTGPFAHRVSTVDGASGGTISSKVSIGPGHTNTGFNAFVAGENNGATGDWSTVGGGIYCFARGQSSVVAGGGAEDLDDSSSAIGGWSTVSGGTRNLALGIYSTVGGGSVNSADDSSTTVGGGRGNVVAGDYATISGGNQNSTTGKYSSVAGGAQNQALDEGAHVGGGANNKARGWYSTVCGGGGFGGVQAPHDSNSAMGTRSSIGGGSRNYASGNSATISGGFDNKASETYATVGGGSNNTSNGFAATTGGGFGNTSDGVYSTISGGSRNAASARLSTIGGGWENKASDTCSTIGGGMFNKARGIYSVVAGGGGPFGFDSNAAIGIASVVSGGRSNIANSPWSTVGGGQNNVADADWATVAGGGGNYARLVATVGGGAQNSASGNYATIPGGFLDTASGDYSFAAGRRAQAVHDGAFVWSDQSGGRFASTDIDQFLIDADGGVGIGTNAPKGALHVEANSNGVSLHVSGGSKDITWKTGQNLQFGEWNGTTFIERMRINGVNGRTGIGVPNPSQILTLPNVASVDGSGLAYAWNVYSSRRWKHDITTIDHALDKVNRLRGVHYKWNSNDETDIGLIAEEVGDVIPEVVTYEENGVDAMSVDYARLVAVLIEAVKEQQGQIEALQIANTALSERLSKFEKEI